MRNVADIDTNLRVETKLDLPDVKFHNAESEPFKIYGLIREDNRYRRMPQAVADTVNEGVADLNRHSAGGRIRFKTDSEYIAISVKMDPVYKSSAMPIAGGGGFDIYLGRDEEFFKTLFPPLSMEDGYESVQHFGGRCMRQITLNFPLYNGVKELFIGLNEDAEIYPPDDYEIEKPIVYYGSSITQGASASRPGLAYQAMISRKFNANFINLGFSGNAKGEETIANYIKTLDMSVFVLDYDHNADSNEHLKNTHENFFKIIRKAHPTLPVVIMARPRWNLAPWEVERNEIIKSTYQNAKDNGDKNVYFIDSKTLMQIAKVDGTGDDLHPNDIGFFSMASALGEVLESIINDLK